MIKILTLTIIAFGIGYLYGANENVRVKTIEILKKGYEKVVELIKRLVTKIKGE